MADFMTQLILQLVTMVRTDRGKKFFQGSFFFYESVVFLMDLALREISFVHRHTI
jgi:hypothetical protein